MPFKVKPTRLDIVVADRVAADTSTSPENIAGALTWGVDAHILFGLAAAWWVFTRSGDVPTRRAGNHLLLCSVASAALPHLFKTFIDQDRPDRRTLVGHLHGVPFSGNKEDAFPSGHALHVGAFASAASGLPPRYRNAVWALGAGLLSTRVILLAHWLSDVAVGAAMGAVLERLLRRATGFQPSDLASAVDLPTTVTNKRDRKVKTALTRSAC